MIATLAYIGIGSNLADPVTQVTGAITALARLPGSRRVAYSPLYRSEPVGPAGQPDYINAAAAIETRLSPEALLQALQALEAASGRVRDVRWGPRTLDLDILMYGDLRRTDPSLTLPHPCLHQRRFVLEPLIAIAPELVVPELGDVRSLLADCPPLDLEQLAQQPIID